MNGTEPNKLKPALIAGIASGAASSVPGLSCINFCCCALIIGGGFLAAFLYLKDAPATPEPAYGDGAILGLMAGVFAAITGTLISIPVQLAFSSMGMGGTEQIRDALDEAGAELPPALMNIMDSVMGSGGLSVVGIMISFFFSLVLFSIFALIGGIIGMAVLHGKVGNQPAAPTGYAPPPPPAV